MPDKAASAVNTIRRVVRAPQLAGEELQGDARGPELFGQCGPTAHELGLDDLA
ncbi:hypothetical protein [Actinomadura formosensis]|uniref:hypothetical protein n=1 Tax=Actinomadura formosensis TaxID=60706 RepID=UPI0012FAA4C2|nr:hypothetical protein [Actinomadura formosensis]